MILKAQIDEVLAPIAAVVREYMAETAAAIYKRVDAVELALANFIKNAVSTTEVQRIVDDALAKYAESHPIPDLADLWENAKAIDPMADRLGNVEKRIEAFRQTPDNLDTLIAAAATKAASDAVSALPTPKDGTSVTVDDVTPLVAAEVAKAVSAIPAAKDGASVTIEDVEPVISETVAKAVAAIPPAVPGKDADMEQVKALIAENSERAAEHFASLLIKHLQSEPACV